MFVPVLACFLFLPCIAPNVSKWPGEQLLSPEIPPKCFLSDFPNSLPTQAVNLLKEPQQFNLFSNVMKKQWGPQDALLTSNCLISSTHVLSIADSDKTKGAQSFAHHDTMEEEQLTRVQSRCLKMSFITSIHCTCRKEEGAAATGGCNDCNKHHTYLKVALRLVRLILQSRSRKQPAGLAH